MIVNNSWYWPRRDRRTAWRGVVVVILVFVLGLVAGDGEAMLCALVTAAVGTSVTEMIAASLRDKPRTE